MSMQIVTITGLTLAALLLIPCTHVFATGSFLDESEQAIGGAIAALRNQKNEDHTNIVMQNSAHWVRSFDFPASWLATLATQENECGFPSVQHFVSKRLTELIYEKANATIRNGGKLKLASPPESYLSKDTVDVQQWLLCPSGAQAILLVPIEVPGSTDDWHASFVGLFVKPPYVSTSESLIEKPRTKTAPQVRNATGSQAITFNPLELQMTPSLQKLNTTHETMMGKDVLATSYSFTKQGVSYRVVDKAVPLDEDGTTAELYVQAPEAVFAEALDAAKILQESALLSPPVLQQSVSNTSAEQQKQNSDLVDVVLQKIDENFLYTERPAYQELHAGNMRNQFPDLKSANGVKMRTALAAVVRSLHDPFSKFYPRLSLQVGGSVTSGSGSSAEIGVWIFPRAGKFFVSKVLPGSPAEKSGILVGDEILQIDKTPASSMNPLEIADLLRGKEGTRLQIGIRRGSTTKKIVAVRAYILNPAEITVQWRGSTAMISVVQFGETTQNSFASIMQDVSLKSPKAIILDLRGNVGGTLLGADAVMSAFLGPGKKFATLRTRAGTEVLKTSEEQKVSSNVPLYVLVDEYSAAATEIVATALQQSQRAIVFGRQTGGFTSVQQLIKLKTGDSLVITTGEWLGADGRSIQGKGVAIAVRFASSDSEKQLQQVLSVISPN